MLGLTEIYTISNNLWLITSINSRTYASLSDYSTPPWSHRRYWQCLSSTRMNMLMCCNRIGWSAELRSKRWVLYSYMFERYTKWCILMWFISMRNNVESQHKWNLSDINNVTHKYNLMSSISQLMDLLFSTRTFDMVRSESFPVCSSVNLELNKIKSVDETWFMAWRA